MRKNIDMKSLARLSIVVHPYVTLRNQNAAPLEFVRRCAISSETLLAEHVLATVKYTVADVNAIRLEKSRHILCSSKRLEADILLPYRESLNANT
jgi:hypothetical protein